MELNKIKPTDNWGMTADNLNANFQKTSVEVEKIRYLTSNSKGLYPTSEALRAAVPNPRDGDWAIVGTTVPGPLWSATGGVWSATGETGGVGNVDLAGYAKSEDLKLVKETADDSKKESTAAKNDASAALKKADEAINASNQASELAANAATDSEEALIASRSASEKAEASEKTALEVASSFSGLSDVVVKTISVINVNELCDDLSYTLATALSAISDQETADSIAYKKRGMVITYRTDNGFETKQFSGAIESWSNEEWWKDFGGGSGSGAGNVFNVSELVPLESGYYTLAAAVVAIPEEFRRKGLVVTFESAQGKWGSYQFIGTSLDAFEAVASWGEFGGAGTVKQITFNGEKQVPDEQGNVTLRVDEIQVDETLTATGTNPVQGKAVHAAIEEIEAGAALLLNTLGDGSEKAFSLSLLDKNGEVLSTTEAFSGGGAGGSVATTKIVLTRITDNLTVKTGDEVKLQFLYDQIDTTSGTTTGNPAQGVVTISRGATSNTIKQTIAAGSSTTLDVSKYIGVGSNTIRVRVTVGEGVEQQVSSIAWSVNVVELKLSSSFNIATVINRGDRVAVPFALQGSGSKTLRLYVNGVDTEDRTIGTSSSNGSFTVDTSAMSHGAHSVQLLAELELSDGKKILSNSIYFDIAVRDGGTTPIIATRFDYAEGTLIGSGERPFIPVRQYDEYTLLYAAYHPNEIPTRVDLYESDSLVSSSMVLFVRNTVKLRAMGSGRAECRMECGSLRYDYALDVSKSDLNLNEPLDNMILKLSAIGRSNSDINREEWTYKQVSTKLEGFKFGGDGWLDGALRLTGNARATVQLMPLKAPVQNVTNAFSFSIRLKVSDVMNEQAEVVRCVDNEGTGFVITTQEARMVTRGNSRVAMKFAAGEIYNIGFVSHPEAVNDSTDYAKTNDSMVYLYINGIMSGGVQRGKSDSIYQTDPAYIAIGSSDCTVDVYSMRAYTAALTDAQMLDAYIVDFNTVDELIHAYNKNDVLDGNGQITVDSLPEDMPYLIITGVQPNGIPTLIHAAIMNNKKTKFNVDQILFVYKSKAYQNFVCFGGCISLQGTSSLAYPIKNYRFYLKDSNKVPGKMYLGCDTLGIGGTLQDKPKYSLTMEEQGTGKISAPVDCFCGKADYAESSSSHNTGMARLVNDVLTSCDLLTPAQRYADKAYPYEVRTTVDGQPIMLFYRNTVNDTPVFAGKFNLNNDKSTEEVFGFVGIPGYHDSEWVQTKFNGQNPVECWEFLNNDYPMGMFLNDDFESKDEEGIPNWLKVFEARFPDDDDLNAEYEAGTRKPDNLMRLVKWVKSTQGNGAKFAAELSDYFDVEYLCAYYMFTEMMGCVDQRVKNMMFGFWYDPKADKVLCYPIFYDCDTILGVRNDGRLKYDPFIDHNSIDTELSTGQKTVYAYAGHDSVLWDNLREQCQPELNAVYKKLRAKMTNDTIFNVFDTEQSARFCERVYNLDALYKYVSPKTRGVDVVNNGQVTTLTYSYMEAMQGSRMSHRHWWVNNRMSLFDARYMTGQYLSTDLTFKGNSAAGATIKATPIRDFYFAFSREGSVMTHVRVSAGQEWSYRYGNMANIGTIFHFYGGEYVRKLDLSHWGGFTDMNLPYMPKLQELTLGMEGYEYQLSELSIGTKMPMLTHLVMRNYTKIPALDLSKSARLQLFDGKGCSALSVVNFAEGSPITNIDYPSNYQTVKLLYLPNLKRSGITFENIKSVTGLWVESCPGIAPITLMGEFPGLKYVRITGLQLSGNGDDLKSWYAAGIGGIDPLGNTVSKCKLCGKYELTAYLDDAVYTQLADRFDELTIKQPEYTMIEFDDNIVDEYNISNLDNRTGNKFRNPYKPSAHILAIQKARHRVLSKRSGENQSTIFPLHDNDSNYFNDATLAGNATPAKLDGTQGDVMVYEPHYWYKGINDVLNGKKYACFSFNKEMPSVPSGGRMLKREDITDVRIGYKVVIANASVREAIKADANYDVMKIPVIGYKKLRYPSASGIGLIGALFVDDTDTILKEVVAEGTLGFVDGMYVICDIPPEATSLYFTVNKNVDFDYVILSNSDRIEDMEPEWVEHNACLVGAHEATFLGSKIVSVASMTTAASSISQAEFAYSAAKRGMQLIDWEMHKDIANRFFAFFGRRDSQDQFGYGSYTTNRIIGETAKLGMRDTKNKDHATRGAWYTETDEWGVETEKSIDSNNCMGYENLLGNKFELLDKVTVPNTSKDRNILYIVMPDGSMRKIKMAYISGYLVKVYHQKYMDVSPASSSTGTSTTCYCDQFAVSNEIDRILFRSGEAASAGAGITFIYSTHSTSNTSTSLGSRLAFRGEIVIAESVAAFKSIEQII